MELLEKIETDTASYYVEDNILFIRTKEDADFTLEAAVEGLEARKKIQEGKRMLILSDTQKVFQVSREARRYGASKEVVEMSIAMAILVGNSLSARLIGNFFIKFNKPATPTKLFRTEENALAWLRGF